MSERDRLRHLAALGAIAVAIYAGAFLALYPLPRMVADAFRGNYDSTRGASPLLFAAYVLAEILLYALYFRAIGLARGLSGRRPLLIIGGLGVLAGAILCLVHPYGAADVFLYVVRGRVLGVYGQNSLLVPPDRFPLEQWIPFPSEWVAEPSPYGPLWEWIAAALARLGDGSLLRSLLLFKGLSLASYAGCLWLSADILHRLAPQRQASGLVALAWNPLILLEAHANGHNDILMAFFVLLALWFWVRRAYPWVFLALTLGGLVKYVPFMLIPLTMLALWRRLPWSTAWRSVLAGGALSLGAAALVTAPLWPGDALPLLVAQLGRIHNSVGYWVILVIGQLFPGVDNFALGQRIMRVLFVLAYLALLWREARSARAPRSPTPADSYLLAFYAWIYLASLAFGYWYVIWPTTLLPFLVDRRAWAETALLSATALASVPLYSFVGAWVWNVVDIWHLHLITVPLIFGLPLILAPWLQRHLARLPGPPPLGLHGEAESSEGASKSCEVLATRT